MPIESRGTGFRVFGRAKQLDEALVAAFSDLDGTNVADAMHGLNCMDGAIRPLYLPIRRVIGQAITVSVSPGDGMMIRPGIAQAKPGDVIVVNSAGAMERAVLGGNILMSMAAAGVAGLIVDGVIRDIGEARGLDFPVFCRGLNPRSGTTSGGHGEVNAPIACGGVAVLPGDVVVADEEGVVVVPARDAVWVAEKARQIQGKKGAQTDLKQRAASVRPGQIGNYDKIRESMMAGGCIMLDHAWER